MSDINARAGSCNNGFEKVMGGHSPGERNVNGKRFLETQPSNSGILFPAQTPL